MVVSGTDEDVKGDRFTQSQLDGRNPLWPRRTTDPFEPHGGPLRNERVMFRPNPAPKPDALELEFTVFVGDGLAWRPSLDVDLCSGHRRASEVEHDASRDAIARQIVAVGRSRRGRLVGACDVPGQRQRHRAGGQEQEHPVDNQGESTRARTAAHDRISLT
jgi:hypothetical protein